jgi:hypothetical protein
VILLDPEEEEAQSAKGSPELNERDLALSEEGTGALVLVYDTAGYQNLLHVLEASLSVSPSKGTHSSRRHTS